VEEEIARLREVLIQAGATRCDLSQDEAQRLRFWSGRKNAFPATGRISADYLCMDASIPRKALATMLEAIEAMQASHGLRCVNVFHAGDGNLHPLILFDANQTGQLQRAEAFGNDILRTAVDLGGTITGEHGVGIEKLDAMCVQFSDDEREQMLAFKAAFDPKGLLNPGKTVPMLARCGELRGVRRTATLDKALADLPRF
jgi:glycolate oxidase